MAVGDSLRSAVIGDELRENDEDLMCAVQRLLSITKMLVGISTVPIAEIHVSPLSLLQTRMADVKEIGFYIALPQPATADVANDLVSIAKALLVDEFEDVRVDVNIIYKCGAKRIPTILMYSIFGNNDPVESIMESTYYWAAYSIVSNLGYEISIPTNFSMQLTKTMFIHIQDASEVITLKRALDNRGFEIDFIECLVRAVKSDGKDASVYYLPTRSDNIVSLGLPYRRLTANSFNKQFVESQLNGDT